MTPLNQAIEAIIKEWQQGETTVHDITSILRSLLPAEEEDRKELARRAYMAVCTNHVVLQDMLQEQFESWYKNEKK